MITTSQSRMCFGEHHQPQSAIPRRAITSTCACTSNPSPNINSQSHEEESDRTTHHRRRNSTNGRCKKNRKHPRRRSADNVHDGGISGDDDNTGIFESFASNAAVFPSIINNDLDMDRHQPRGYFKRAAALTMSMDDALQCESDNNKGDNGNDGNDGVATTRGNGVDCDESQLSNLSPVPATGRLRDSETAVAPPPMPLLAEDTRTGSAASSVVGTPCRSRYECYKLVTADLSQSFDGQDYETLRRFVDAAEEAARADGRCPESVLSYSSLKDLKDLKPIRSSRGGSSEKPQVRQEEGHILADMLLYFKLGGIQRTSSDVSQDRTPQKRTPQHNLFSLSSVFRSSTSSHNRNGPGKTHSTRSSEPGADVEVTKSNGCPPEGCYKEKIRGNGSGSGGRLQSRRSSRSKKGSPQLDPMDISSHVMLARSDLNDLEAIAGTLDSSDSFDDDDDDLPAFSSGGEGYGQTDPLDMSRTPPRWSSFDELEGLSLDNSPCPSDNDGDENSMTRVHISDPLDISNHHAMRFKSGEDPGIKSNGGGSALDISSHAMRRSFTAEDKEELLSSILPNAATDTATESESAIQSVLDIYTPARSRSKSPSSSSVSSLKRQPSGTVFSDKESESQDLGSVPEETLIDRNVVSTRGRKPRRRHSEKLSVDDVSSKEDKVKTRRNSEPNEGPISKSPPRVTVRRKHKPLHRCSTQKSVSGILRTAPRYGGSGNGMSRGTSCEEELFQMTINTRRKRSNSLPTSFMGRRDVKLVNENWMALCQTSGTTGSCITKRNGQGKRFSEGDGGCRDNDWVPNGVEFCKTMDVYVFEKYK